MSALFLRDVRLGMRAGGGMLVGLLFFLSVIAVIPFGIGPDLALLKRIGPAMIWIAVLLASLLGLDRLFQIDREAGALDLLIADDARHWLPLVVLVKCAAHWAVSILPLIVAVPVFGLLVNLDAMQMAATVITLIFGSPAIIFIGAVGAAVAVALPRGGLLVSILVLPLVVPILIFGIAATNGAVDPVLPFSAPFAILTALTLLFAVIGPFAAAATLRALAD